MININGLWEQIGTIKDEEIKSFPVPPTSDPLRLGYSQEIETFFIIYRLCLIGIMQSRRPTFASYCPRHSESVPTKSILSTKFDKDPRYIKLIKFALVIHYYAQFDQPITISGFRHIILTTLHER